MTSDEVEYWRRRAFQEQLAAQDAASSIAHQRHTDLSQMYRIRAANLAIDPELRPEECRTMATADAE